MLKFWSKTQAVVALGSAEAELGAAVKASQELLGMMSVWQDVGETTQGHGIIRRTGLGEVRSLNTSWSCVQEKETSRSDNSANLFTKALDHDSIVRHTEVMGCELLFRRDPIAFTVNNMEKSSFKTSGKMDAWTRMDLHSKTYKTTADAGSGEIINIEEAMNINRDEGH